MQVCGAQADVAVWKKGVILVHRSYNLGGNLTLVVEFLQQLFIPFDRVALLGGDRGKVYFYEVGNCPRQPPVQGVETAAQIDDLTRLFARLLKQFVDAHFHAPNSCVVAAIYLRSLPNGVLHEATDVVVLPVAQLDGA